MKTTHNAKCKMSFGRPTKQAGECPRCDELREGAQPRKGWNDAKIKREAQFVESLRKHNCKASGCSFVCTFGDW